MNPLTTAELGDNDCPVCFEVMQEPTSLPCGHRVCHGCFEMWANLSNHCPFCKRPMEDVQTVLNRTLTSLKDHLQGSIDALNKIKTIRSHISDDPRSRALSLQLKQLIDLSYDVGIQQDGSDQLHVMPDTGINEIMNLMIANMQPISLPMPPQVAPTGPSANPTQTSPPSSSQPQNIQGRSDIFGMFQMPQIPPMFPFMPQFDTTTTIRRQFHIPARTATAPAAPAAPAAPPAPPAAPAAPPAAPAAQTENPLESILSSMFSQMMSQGSSSGSPPPPTPPTN